MENHQNGHNGPPPEPTVNIFNTITAKVILIGVLTLVLLIPLQFVKNLIWERAERQEGVVSEINSQWGGSVYFYGPVLKVPYKVFTETSTTNEKTKQVTISRTASTEYAYFFPEQLKINSNVDTDALYRNNYEATVFNAKMNFTGSYPKPDFSSEQVKPEHIEWDKASFVIRTNNQKSIDGAINIDFNGNKYAFEPTAGDKHDTITSLETKAINLSGHDWAGSNFSMDVAYKGSEQLKIAPVGKITQAKMHSNWDTPSFTGNFIPGNKAVTNEGFDASWSISHLNRPFPQQFFGYLPDLSDYAFGVNFLIPVDEYQQNERAAKYGFLVIGLTFLVFFLIQTMSKINIHLFQYTMIGLALIMFYTLLISITEHSSFLLAYIIAGVSVVVMITLYSISILRNIKFPAFIASSLTGLYTFIYVIIQLENYALLAGSIGLFLILGAVMYISRKIDWTTARV